MYERRRRSSVTVMVESDSRVRLGTLLVGNTGPISGVECAEEAGVDRGVD